MRSIRKAFERAAADEGYRGRYRCVYPVKVNQARHVCEEVRDLAAQHGFGLEIGTKPELLAVLALTEPHPDMPIVCNGFKDDDYLETVVLAAKLGRNIIPVVERYEELPKLIELMERYGVRLALGVRIRLTARGNGRWAQTTGDRGKFGLSVGELVAAVQLLERHDALDCLRLLHYHLGSQISDIRSVKTAIAELAHLYVEVVRLGAPMGMVDVGGGLGIDYDGTGSTGDASINYDLDEYAADIVSRLAAACDRAGVEHPDILSESGRALTAFSSVLVCEVVGDRRPGATPAPIDVASLDQDTLPLPVRELVEARATASTAVAHQLYHDAVHSRAEADSLFRIGEMSIELRAATDQLFWETCGVLRSRIEEMEEPERTELEALLVDLYYCNLSVFQSLPDSWAIDQLFPIVPLHRLDEQPARRAVLMDITCDSDGRVDRFIDGDGVADALPVHSLRPSKDDPGTPESYLLGVFLVGAYQETLGDLHNLLGDTHAVHVDVGPEGRWRITDVVEGDTVREVLSYVHFDVEDLRRSFRRSVEAAIEAEGIDVSEATRLRRFFEHGLEGYTYLERRPPRSGP